MFYFSEILHRLCKTEIPPSLDTHWCTDGAVTVTPKSSTNQEAVATGAGARVWRDSLTAVCCPGWPASRPPKTGVASGRGRGRDACCGRRWTGCAPTSVWAPRLNRTHVKYKHYVTADIWLCRSVQTSASDYPDRSWLHTVAAVLGSVNETLKQMYANNYHTHMTLHQQGYAILFLSDVFLPSFCLVIFETRPCMLNALHFNAIFRNILFTFWLCSVTTVLPVKLSL